MFSNSSRLDKIKALQKTPEKIRNICIIAHVDHGKTTLSDCLLSSNNIISRKLAGKLRLLDTRPDEQERRITMKSSSISLIFNHNGEDHLINLIDSPGHVEFSSEVASALRLCDGALILVDAKEGVSCQTLHVLKQAFEEKVQTLLVINKIDRLILELGMTPDEAYKHLCVIIDEMNAALSSYINTDLNSAKTEQLEEQGETKLTQEKIDANLVIDEKILEELENKVYFSPEKNNVLFASAIDCWCFDAMTFAKILGAKLGCNPKALLKYMWGEYYLDLKNRKIFKNQYHSKVKPIFVQYVLESLWKVYEAIKDGDAEKMQKIAKALQITLPDNFAEILAKDTQSALNLFMWKWLPIDEIILRNVVVSLPNPIQSQKLRLPKICKKLVTFEKLSKGHSEETKNQLRRIRQAVETCDNSPDAPIVIYVSKIINVPKENINEHGLVPLSEMNFESKFVGFARIFSGVLKRGSEVFIISARNKDDKKNEYAFDKKKDEDIKGRIDSIYLQFSQYLEGIPEISAGNCFALGDTENALYKTATVSNVLCPSFSPMIFGAMSLLKVAISPKDLNDYPQLFAGLKKLNKSDPSVEIYYHENGDLILSTCGEVHLERCVRDLETMYAKVEVKTSEPIVSFKETIMSENVKAQAFNPAVQEAEKIVYEKPTAKGERRPKKERTKKTLEVTGDDEDEIEIDEDTGINAKEDEVQVSNLIKRAGPKNLVSKNYSKVQLKTNKVNTLDVKKKTNVFECTTPNQRFLIRIRAIALKSEVAQWLESKTSKMRKIFVGDHLHMEKETIQEFIDEFNKLLKQNDTDPSIIELINNNLVCFGPRKYGPNLLVNKLIQPHQSLFHQIFDKKPFEDEAEEVKEFEKDILKSEKASSSKASSKIEKLGRKTKEILKGYYRLTFEELSNAIAAGFDLASNSGPLCEEPMIGVCFIVEDFKFVEDFMMKPDPSKAQSKQNEDEIEREKEKEQEIQRLKAWLKEKEMEKALAKKKAEEEALAKQRERAAKKDYELLEEMDREFAENEEKDDEEEAAENQKKEKQEQAEKENEEAKEMEAKPEEEQNQENQEKQEQEQTGEKTNGEKEEAKEIEAKPEPEQNTNLEAEANTKEVSKEEDTRLEEEMIKYEEQPGNKEIAEDLDLKEKEKEPLIPGEETKDADETDAQRSPTKIESANKRPNKNPRVENQNGNLESRSSKKEEKTPKKRENFNADLQNQERTEEASPLKNNEQLKQDYNDREEQKVAETASTSANEKVDITKLLSSDPYGPISGQIMSTVKEACLESFLGGEPRLVEAVYLCHLQVPMTEIGAVYDVLNKRRAKVVTEDINEMNNLTVIKAHLPVCESFGLYSEMWRKTSGTVNPQLEFDTWRTIEVDPFYMPETEEEKEEFGESGIFYNFAKNLILKIRKRKGLQTDEKTVAAAEKQRTLARKK